MKEKDTRLGRINLLRNDAAQHLVRHGGTIIESWYIDYQTEEEAGADIVLSDGTYHLQIFGKKQ